MIRAVLFDLDGTLLDTAPDLIAALNQVRIEENMAAMPHNTLKQQVSNGATAMLKVVFPELNNEQLKPLKDRFLEHYRNRLAIETRPFPGINETLTMLEENHIRWGIVTNKPSWLTEPLLEQLGLASRAGCIVSGDTTDNSKPHPEPLLHACSALGADADSCLYIGDARRDIEAAKRAGMQSLIALFGYIGNRENPNDWGADDMIQSPKDIIHWVTAQNDTRQSTNQ